MQATYRTLIGLLAVTGMRVGEAIALDQGDFDAGSGMVTIRHGKFDKARALPLHPTTVAALQGYLHADLQIKERALERTAPITTKPGRFRPTDKLLAFLEGL